MSIFNIFKKKQNEEEMVNQPIPQTIDPIDEQFDSNYLTESPELVGYPSAEIQELIYNIALEGIEPGESIVDYGCGRGDIATMMPESKYTGIDFNGVMKSVSTLSDEEFINDDWFNSNVVADWALNVLSLTIPYTEEQILNPYEYSIKTIDHMLDHAKLGAVIVCIDSDVEEYVEGSIAISSTELVRHYGKEYRLMLDKSFNTNMFKLLIFK